MRRIKLMAEGLTLLALLLPFFRWGSARNWELSGLDSLAIFPLLGLWAFALMWTHYVMSAVKRHYPDGMEYDVWYKRTSSLVLVLFLLHPILLFINGSMNNYTAFDYVSVNNQLYVAFGMLALAGFLLWEVVAKFRERAFVKRNLPLFSALNNAAFLAVFFHGLFVGQHLQSGWLRIIWLVMGVSYGLIVAHNYYFALQDEAETTV